MSDPLGQLEMEREDEDMGKLPGVHVPEGTPKEPPPAVVRKATSASAGLDVTFRIAVRKRALDCAAKHFLGEKVDPARVLAVAVLFEGYILHGAEPEDT